MFNVFMKCSADSSMNYENIDSKESINKMAMQLNDLIKKGQNTASIIEQSPSKPIALILNEMYNEFDCNIGDILKNNAISIQKSIDIIKEMQSINLNLFWEAFWDCLDKNNKISQQKITKIVEMLEIMDIETASNLFIKGPGIEHSTQEAICKKIDADKLINIFEKSLKICSTKGSLQSSHAFDILNTMLNPKNFNNFSKEKHQSMIDKALYIFNRLGGNILLMQNEELKKTLLILKSHTKTKQLYSELITKLKPEVKDIIQKYIIEKESINKISVSALIISSLLLICSIFDTYLV